MKKLILLFLGFALISCTAFKVQKSAAFLNFVKNYNNFKWQGYIEVNHKQYAFRKDCVLRKNEKAIRLDIFDGGVMGLSPAPFFSFYIDKEIVQIKNLETKQIDTFKTIDFEKEHKISFSKLMDLANFLQSQKQLKPEMKYQDLALFLNAKGLVKQVNFDDASLFFEWNKEVLNKLIFWQSNSKKGEFEIVKITNKQQKINKLKGN